MLTPRKKKSVIVDFARHDTDTGSAEVQIGVLSKQINELVAHLKKHEKDIHSRRGLLKMVSKRRRLLHYLGAHDEKKHADVSKKIGL